MFRCGECGWWWLIPWAHRHWFVRTTRRARSFGRQYLASETRTPPPRVDHTLGHSRWVMCEGTYQQQCPEDPEAAEVQDRRRRWTRPWGDEAMAEPPAHPRSRRQRRRMVVIKEHAAKLNRTVVPSSLNFQTAVDRRFEPFYLQWLKETCMLHEDTLGKQLRGDIPEANIFFIKGTHLNFRL